MTEYAVFCGIDVGKTDHFAVGLDAEGKRLYDKALPNDETQLRRCSTSSSATARS